VKILPPEFLADHAEINSFDIERETERSPPGLTSITNKDDI
jgi:hypothetical protein